MAELLNSGWVQGGAVGVVLAALYLLFTGRLYPRSMVKELAAQSAANVAQANENARMWRDAYEREVDRGDVLAKQVGQLLDGMTTVERLVRALVPRDKDPVA